MAGLASSSSSRLYSLPPHHHPPYGRYIHGVNSETLYAPDMASRARRSNSKGEKPSTFFFSKKREPICPLIAQSTKSVTSNKHDPICAISVQRVPPISLTPSTPNSLPCRFSQSIQYISLNSRANATRFVPCLFSQNPPPQTSAIRSVPCRLSQSGLCDCLVQSKSST